MALGKTRKPWIYIRRRQTTPFQDALNRAVVQVYGGVDLRRAKLIRSACTAFESAQRIRRILAYGGEPGTDTGLDHATWLAYDAALQAREAACDKALAALDVGKVRTVKDFYQEYLDDEQAKQAQRVASPTTTAPKGMESQNGTLP